MKFTKMHGLGNDFIVFDEREKPTELDWVDLTPKLCDRHMGIGADGVVRVLPSHKADYRMEIINSDGSVPEMCGNGIRCFAKYVFEHSPDHKEVFSVETPAGIIVPAIEIRDRQVVAVEVDMGEPILDPKKIPVLVKDQPVLNQKITVQGKEFVYSAVSMGNPHIVIYENDVDVMDLAKWGPLLETDELFPNKTNVHFVQVISDQEIKIRHWERGAGETLACGTGTCASVVASHLLEKTGRSVLAQVPGGSLRIDWNKETNHVLMLGPAQKVYEGEINL